MLRVPGHPARDSGGLPHRAHAAVRSRKPAIVNKLELSHASFEFAGDLIGVLIG